MITTINEFKKTLNENLSFDKFNGLKAASIDFIPFQIVNYKIDQNVSNTVYLLQIYFTELNSYGLCIYDATDRRFIEEPGTYEIFDTTPEQIENQYGFKHNFNINENWFKNLFKKRKEKRVTPQYTPDPIPVDADWWWNNDVFVFGSNTEGNHAGGAAKAAVVNYGAIMGQARGLQGNSYGIVTLDYTGNEPVTIETIGQELDNFIEFAKSHPSLLFWMTKIGTGISRIPFDQIAQLFFDREFPRNVKLPIEFSK